MSRVPVTLSVVSLLVALASFSRAPAALERLPSPEPRRPESNVEGHLADLDAAVGALVSRSRELAAEVDLLAADVTPSEPSEPSDLSEAEELVAAAMIAMDAAWSEETPDPRWQAEATLAMTDAVDTAIGPDLVARTVACRSTMCRVELTFSSLAGRDHHMSRLSLDLPWSGEGMSRESSDDGLEVTVFQAREGFPLPRVR